MPGWLCLAILLLYLGMGSLVASQYYQVSLIDGLVHTFSLLLTIGMTLEAGRGAVSPLCVLLTSLYILGGAAPQTVSAQRVFPASAL